MAIQTIYTNKDTFTSSSNPTTNYGTSTYMLVHSGYNNGYIGFDVTSAPASSSVTSVLMYYYVIEYGGSPTADAKRTTSAWTETGVTWNNSPTTTDTNAANFTIADLDTWGSVNITNIYKDAKNSGNTLGVAILNASGGKRLASKEYSSGTYKAYIVITYSVGNDFYVKTTGNDSLSGDSWANAWKTINKAATTVADGVTVHIGFGTYDAEPAANKIAPQNIGSLGIYYLPETATTGGGTGTVLVEQNT